MQNIVCHLCGKDFVADEILLICANEHHLCADCGKKLNLLCEVRILLNSIFDSNELKVKSLIISALNL